MVVKNLGKIAYRGGSLFRFKGEKVEKHSCEHCGDFRSKTYYGLGNSAKKIGVTWCKNCADTFDLSPEAPQKFKDGQTVYYEAHGGNRHAAKVLYYSYEGHVECEINGSSGSWRHNFKENELSETDKV